MLDRNVKEFLTGFERAALLLQRIIGGPPS